MDDKTFAAEAALTWARANAANKEPVAFGADVARVYRHCLTSLELQAWLGDFTPDGKPTKLEPIPGSMGGVGHVTFSDDAGRLHMFATSLAFRADSGFAEVPPRGFAQQQGPTQFAGPAHPVPSAAPADEGAGPEGSGC